MCLNGTKQHCGCRSSAWPEVEVLRTRIDGSQEPAGEAASDPEETSWKLREMPSCTLPPLEHPWLWWRCSGPQVKRVGVVAFKTAHGIDRAEPK